MKITLTSVRLSFPALFEPKAGPDGGAPKYSAAFIIEPGSKNAKALKDACAAVANEKWGAKAAGTMKELYAKDKVCYKENEKANSSGDVYAGFEGMHFVNTSNKARPTVVDADKSPLTAQDGKPYGGCYVNAIIDIWPQDNGYGKRVNATLMGVQFVKDGDAFVGGTPASPDDFDVVAGADAEDLA
jgi:hypothetical protein